MSILKRKDGTLWLSNSTAGRNAVGWYPDRLRTCESTMQIGLPLVWRTSVRVKGFLPESWNWDESSSPLAGKLDLKGANPIFIPSSFFSIEASSRSSLSPGANAAAIYMGEIFVSIKPDAAAGEPHAESGDLLDGDTGDGEIHCAGPGVPAVTGSALCH